MVSIKSYGLKKYLVFLEDVGSGVTSLVVLVYLLRLLVKLKTNLMNAWRIGIARTIRSLLGSSTLRFLLLDFNLVVLIRPRKHEIYLPTGISLWILPISLGRNLHRMHYEAGQSINDFFLSRMHTIWDQLALFEPHWDVDSDTHKFTGYCDHRRVMQFFMALNDEFQLVRASLLHHNYPNYL